MKKILVFILFIFLIILGSGCNKSVQSSENEKSILSSIPTPVTGTGVVYGEVNIKNPPLESILFLTKNLSEGQTDIPAALAFSYNHDPRALQNENGEFVFSDVPPGEYALVFWSVDGIKVVPSTSNKNTFLLIEVIEGSQLNLGKIDEP